MFHILWLCYLPDFFFLKYLITDTVINKIMATLITGHTTIDVSGFIFFIKGVQILDMIKKIIR